jgi:hypothetical protein
MGKTSLHNVNFLNNLIHNQNKMFHNIIFLIPIKDKDKKM